MGWWCRLDVARRGAAPGLPPVGLEAVRCWQGAAGVLRAVVAYGWGALQETPAAVAVMVVHVRVTADEARSADDFERVTVMGDRCMNWECCGGGADLRGDLEWNGGGGRHPGAQTQS